MSVVEQIRKLALETYDRTKWLLRDWRGTIEFENALLASHTILLTARLPDNNAVHLSLSEEDPNLPETDLKEKFDEFNHALPPGTKVNICIADYSGKVIYSRGDFVKK